MAEVTTEPMLEILKSIQARLAQVDGKIDELKQEMQAPRTSRNGIRHEITSVFQEIPEFMPPSCGMKVAWTVLKSASNSMMRQA